MVFAFINILKSSKLLACNIRKISSVTFSEQKIRFGDTTINYVKSGSGKESVLLMPGALGSAWTDFKPQIENLPNELPDHTIYSWDLPGYGRSIPPSRNFNINFFTEDAIIANSFMKALGVNKYSILGWSDGGITGLIVRIFSIFVFKATIIF